MKTLFMLVCVIFLAGCSYVKAIEGQSQFTRISLMTNFQAQKFSVSKDSNGALQVELDGAQSDQAAAVEAAVRGALQAVLKTQPVTP